MSAAMATRFEMTMSEFDDVRPLEGIRAPLKVRHDLRQVFARWLSPPPRPRILLGEDGVVDESDLLNVCMYYRVEYVGGREDVAATWDRSEQRVAEGAPTFDQLVKQGWVSFDGGRWLMQSPPIPLWSHVSYPSEATKEFLQSLSNKRLVAREERGTPPADVKALADMVFSEEWRSSQIPVRDPECIAGRLWERTCPQAQGDSDDEAEPDADLVDTAFLEWQAWCDVLFCAGHWDINWNSGRAKCCREAAQRVLERQEIWAGWDDDVPRYLDLLERGYGIPPEHIRFGTGPGLAPPSTLVARVDWLRFPAVEYLVMERFGRGSAAAAFQTLCAELESTGSGPNITASATAILEFAADHPMGLQMLLFDVGGVPALLVDLLMNSRTACMAAKLVIEWRQQRERESDRDIRREAQTKEFAVQDALSLIAHHLQAGVLDLEECAALLTWCYAGGGGGRDAVADSRQPAGRRLLGVVVSGTQETQSAVLRHLVNQVVTHDNVRRARFKAVLDAAGLLPMATGADISSIVAVYADFARSLQLNWTDAETLSAELAARFVAFALALEEAERDAFLVPIDVAKRLREVTGEDKYSVRNDVAQTLRTHIRFLARAVAGWPAGEVPADLGNALQALVARGAIEHAEKGRLGAVTERYAPRRYLGSERGTPARDLAAAWRRLDGAAKDALLQSLLQSDDPVLLAELAHNLPAVGKALVQTRLRQLKPDEASEAWTWPEMQQRVTSLLAIGEVELARQHYEVVRSALGRAQSKVRLAFFALGLQLLTKEQNWDALDSTVVPPTMDEGTKRLAQDQLTFYRATSQLLRPNGKLAKARVALQRLAAKPGAGSAYKENVFAIAVQELLGPTLRPLTGNEKVLGEALLAEIDAVLAGASAAARSSLAANRALLLLVLQRPGDALEGLAVWRQGKSTAEYELIAALATAEIGRRDGAVAILDAAITEFGADVRLIDVKRELEAKSASMTSTPTTVVVTEIVDRLTPVRAALHQLTQLDVSDVGDLLGPPNEKLPGFLVREVSSALGALQVMSAMLRPRRTASNDAKLEDDLNSTIRHYLARSLAIPKWHVSEQPPGGVTVNGNPGRRDAAIYAFNTEIAIYEALVCSTVNRTTIEEHFEKLFFYGRCQLYFLAIYSYVKEVKPLLSYLRKMLEQRMPAGYTFVRCKTLRRPDHATPGFLATYRADHEEVTVAVLVAELRVPGAVVTKPSTPPKP